MISSTLSLCANAKNRNNPEDINQSRESFSEQIISLNKAIRKDYIKLSEQQSHQLPSTTGKKPVRHTPKRPKQLPETKYGSGKPTENQSP